jgi:hypothetical protein
VPNEAGPYFCYPYLALGIFAVLAADLGVLLRRAVTGPVFVAGWLLLAGVGAWAWLVCIPSVVEVSRGRLRYEAPGARGAFPLRRITGLCRVGGSVVVVGLAGRVPLVIPMRAGFGPVAAALTGHPCRPG